MLTKNVLRNVPNHVQNGTFPGTFFANISFLTCSYISNGLSSEGFDEYLEPRCLSPWFMKPQDMNVLTYTDRRDNCLATERIKLNTKTIWNRIINITVPIVYKQCNKIVDLFTFLLLFFTENTMLVVIF